MVEDFTTTPENGSPLPFDTVTLRPGNSVGADPDDTFVVADLPPEAGENAYELNHPDDHPAYWDWAATVPITDIATTRCTETSPVTWNPAR